MPALSSFHFYYRAVLLFDIALNALAISFSLCILIDVFPLSLYFLHRIVCMCGFEIIDNITNTPIQMQVIYLQIAI